MYKNQLQELAQRSCFNLPSYSCIREGPDHAPRFKAKVNFNGEVFESPNFFSTLRQAEHASAEIALKTLSQRGPSRALAARVLVLLHCLIIVPFISLLSCFIALNTWAFFFGTMQPLSLSVAWDWGNIWVKRHCNCLFIYLFTFQCHGSNSYLWTI